MSEHILSGAIIVIMDFIPKCNSVISLIYDAELVGAPITQRELHERAVQLMPSEEFPNILHYLLDADIVYDISEDDRYLFKVNSDYIICTNNILKAEHIKESTVTT